MTPHHFKPYLVCKSETKLFLGFSFFQVQILACVAWGRDKERIWESLLGTVDARFEETSHWRKRGNRKRGQRAHGRIRRMEVLSSFRVESRWWGLGFGGYRDAPESLQIFKGKFSSLTDRPLEWRGPDAKWHAGSQDALWSPWHPLHPILLYLNIKRVKNDGG